VNEITPPNCCTETVKKYPKCGFQHDARERISKL
jgi:hypothetical protein